MTKECMNLEIKNTLFNNLIPTKIVGVWFDDPFRPRSKDLEKEFLWLTTSTGCRTLNKYYSCNYLQNKLTEYMNSIDADANDPDRNLMLVLSRKRYFVLENALGSEVFPEGLPRIEEASKATRCLFYLLMDSSNNAYFVDETDAEEFARSCGYTWNEMEEALVKDVKRFNLGNVMHFYTYGAAVWVSADFLSSFSTKAKFRKKKGSPEKPVPARIIACDYAIQPPLFPENDTVYIYAESGKSNRILSFSFTELQERLKKHMDDIFQVDSTDRDLVFVLKNKHYAILAGALEKEFYQEIPSLKRASKPLKLLFHRLLDSPETNYYVFESEAETIAKSIGLTWCQMEERLKKDIEYFKLEDVFCFHVKSGRFGLFNK